MLRKPLFHCSHNIAFLHKLYHGRPPTVYGSAHQCCNPQIWHFASSFHPFINLRVPNFRNNIVPHPLFKVRTLGYEQKLHYLRCVVIDAAHKARNVSMFVRANDQPLGRISCPKECHKTVTIVVFSVLQIINISSKFSYEGHILNICISLHNETANSYV